jgi:hypothetical protein
MKPSASSATDWTKPGPARVTNTPAAEAASTSMLRISTAQRTKARKFGSAGNISPGPAVSRSATMISTSRAASIRPAASSASFASCSFTSAMACSPLRLRSP